jgi:hypothetical protein
MVNSVYGVVMAGILLFPWSLVLVMVGGSVWQKVQGRFRARLSRLRSAPVGRFSSSAGVNSDSPAVAQVAACR